MIGLPPFLSFSENERILQLKILMIILRTVKNISSLNIAASVLLFLAAILAAVVANSSLSPVYQDFLLQELHLRIGNFNLFSHGGHPLKMIEFINDCLMTVFFLAVGLEIKRELLVGELSSVRKAALPFIAACGGMVVPVVIYALSVASSTPETRGMAIPMATDIAFSLGVLSLLGKRVPLSLKIFLTAFAVVDDIGGILVIALFYSADVAYGYLIAAAVLYVFLYYMGKFGVTQKIFFLFFGVIIWYLFLQSGIHSTISGVILAFVIPARPRLDAGKYIERIRDIIGEFPVSKSDNIVLTNAQIATLKQVERASDYVISPLQSLEDNLHGAVSFVILPLFAFANAGVVFSGSGSLAFLFDHKCVFTFKKKDGMDMEEFILDMIDFDIDEDYEEDEEEGTITIYGDPKSYAAIQKHLEEGGFEDVGGEFTYIANDLKDVEPAHRETIDKMVERLEEFDDVQTVYTNMKPEESEE